MRLLDGGFLAEFIKIRQIREIEKLRRNGRPRPHLAIIDTGGDPVSDAYIKLKGKYAAETGVSASLRRCRQPQVPALLEELGGDPSTNGIIVQLPLADPSATDDICRLIPASKDIDGLNPGSGKSSATAEAIDWLLAGYGVNLRDKKLVIIGKGKLVGEPLFKLWRDAGLDVSAMDETDLSAAAVKAADVVVTAAGKPGLLAAKNLDGGAVVVDAGTTSVGGRLKGDLADDAYDPKNNLTVTPRKGGVGPMTIAVLFERLLAAAGSEPAGAVRRANPKK